MAESGQIFRKFQAVVLLRRKLLSQLLATDEFDLVVMIGAAAEKGEPLGFKQIELMGLMSTSTLQRRLRQLVERKVIKKREVDIDGRRIAYFPTRQTAEAYHKLHDVMMSNGL